MSRRDFHGWSLSGMLAFSVAVPAVLGWRGSAGAVIGFATMFVVMYAAANWRRR